MPTKLLWVEFTPWSVQAGGGVVRLLAVYCRSESCGTEKRAPAENPISPDVGSPYLEHAGGGGPGVGEAIGRSDGDGA